MRYFLFLSLSLRGGYCLLGYLMRTDLRRAEIMVSSFYDGESESYYLGLEVRLFLGFLGF